MVGDFKIKTDLDSYLLDINDGFDSVLFKDIFDVRGVKIDEPTLLIIDPSYNIKLVFYNPEKEPAAKKMYFDELVATYFNNLKLGQN